MSSSRLRGVEIIDIRSDKIEESLSQVLIKGLNPENGGPRSMPTLLLYDEQGLKLFEKITYLDEYYLTNAEIETLERNADKIAERIPYGSRVVELGSGNLRKVDILFKAFERAEKAVDYFALDLSISELHRTFAELSTEEYNFVTFHGLHGTYDDGLAWLSRPENSSKPSCVLTLGSSMGNFARDKAAKFLKGFGEVLGPNGTFIVGLDGCQDAEKVYHAYNDSEGVTEKFYRNGLGHANKILGQQVFKQDEWAIEGTYNEQLHRHEAYYVALKELKIGKISIPKGEKLKFEEAHKYSESQSDDLWHAAGFIPQMVCSNHDGSYNIYLLSFSKMDFAVKPTEYARQPVPTMDQWRQLWNTWDTVTKSMIPREELMNKPIKLRNNLIFYLGHIPTFADIHVTKATGAKPIEPAYYATIFERGIDPDVDNPEICHSHSEIPETWPPMEDIMQYQYDLRERVMKLVDSGASQSNRKLGRGLWLAFEHEAMHLETFLYMLLQSERVLPPPGSKKPDFRSLALKAKNRRVPNAWHKIPASTVTLGLDDAENDLGPDRYFGWDIERPSRKATVGSFEAQTRPISNGEYARFLEMTGNQTVPVSWTTKVQNGYANGMNGHHANGKRSGASIDSPYAPSNSFLEDKAIRTVFGLVALEYVLDWPVMASYDELAAFAKWSNGRIPTLEEVRSIYTYVEAEKAKVQRYPSKLISAVNGHLCNNGVQETPPAHPSSHSSGADAAPTEPRANGNGRLAPDPNALFIDLNGSNVGFSNWHPTPVTHLTDLCGQSEAGGLWEWTSTPLAAFPGFKAMDLYPGYSADFFDQKHNICLGGSWATIPRIAGRKTFVNWYQRNYPYVWCTARLVRDI